MCKTAHSQWGFRGAVKTDSYYFDIVGDIPIGDGMTDRQRKVIPEPPPPVENSITRNVICSKCTTSLHTGHALKHGKCYHCMNDKERKDTTVPMGNKYNKGKGGR